MQFLAQVGVAHHEVHQAAVRWTTGARNAQGARLTQSDRTLRCDHDGSLPPTENSQSVQHRSGQRLPDKRPDLRVKGPQKSVERPCCSANTGRDGTGTYRAGASVRRVPWSIERPTARRGLIVPGPQVTAYRLRMTALRTSSIHMTKLATVAARSLWSTLRAVVSSSCCSIERGRTSRSAARGDLLANDPEVTSPRRGPWNSKPPSLRR